ncbi:MAG TPA: hypothetical protein VJR58_25325 [Vineibacter sp.]|nr:hypothetical protein [Vineibacter sp.]
MDTPRVVVLASRSGEEIANVLQKLLVENGLSSTYLGSTELALGNGPIDTPRRMALRSDFGIRVILPADLAGATSVRDGIMYDLGVMSGAVGVGRCVALLVAPDGARVDLGGLAGLVIDDLAVNTKGDLPAQLRPYASLLAGRIREIDGNAAFTMRPSTGLAIHYFTTFLAPTLDALRSRRTVVVLQPGRGDQPDRAIVQVSGRLAVCLPESPERATRGGWLSLARRLRLKRVQLRMGPEREDGAQRLYEMWIDPAGALYDAPAAVVSVMESVRRVVVDGMGQDRQPAQAHALHNFKRMLWNLVREPEQAWMRDRLDILHWDELERRADGL